MIRDQRLFFQGLRYGLVGAIVLLADFATYGAILWADPAAYLPANWLGKLTGAALGFMLHKYVTYSWTQRDGTARQLARYIALLACNLALSSGLLWLLVGLAGGNVYLSKILVDGVVIAVAFLGSRLLVFRPA